MALKLFDSLHKAGLRPDKGTYNAAVLACFKGHQVCVRACVLISRLYQKGYTSSTLFKIFFLYG